MKYSNIMIDIETLATSPDAAILTIGAVAFNCSKKDGFDVQPEAEWFHLGLSAAENVSSYATLVGVLDNRRMKLDLETVR